MQYERSTIKTCVIFFSQYERRREQRYDALISRNRKPGFTVLEMMNIYRETIRAIEPWCDCICRKYVMKYRAILCYNCDIFIWIKIKSSETNLKKHLQKCTHFCMLNINVPLFVMINLTYIYYYNNNTYAAEILYQKHLMKMIC